MEKITRRRALTSIAGAPAVGLAASTPLLASSNEIERLFSEWLSVRTEDWSDLGPEEIEARYEVYAHLRDAVREIEPVSARDLAMQFYCEAEAGDSDYSDMFLDKMAALAGAA